MIEVITALALVLSVGMCIFMYCKLRDLEDKVSQVEELAERADSGTIVLARAMQDIQQATLEISKAYKKVLRDAYEKQMKEKTARVKRASVGK